jgi:hypothetical protein
MYPSSQLCHAQEKVQLDRAAGTSLANVHRIATNAAMMWRKEGISAEKREKRASSAQARLALSGLLAASPAEENDSFDSENPDSRITSR